VAHGDPIIHRDGVEFFGHAGGFNLLGNQFAEIAQVHVPGTNWVKELTTAIIGLPKSASVIRATTRGRPPYCGHVWWWRNGT
jgi:hypothetical protein